MEVAAPQHEADHEDYGLECQEALDLPLAELIDKVRAAGWEPRQVYRAVGELARVQALAYEEDPDPAGE
jgi:hypothetical protein